MDDNLFDEDDALDYTLYEDCENETKKPSGCAGVLVLLAVPPAAFVVIQFI